MLSNVQLAYVAEQVNSVGAAMSPSYSFVGVLQIPGNRLCVLVENETNHGVDNVHGSHGWRDDDAVNPAFIETVVRLKQSLQAQGPLPW